MNFIVRTGADWRRFVAWFGSQPQVRTVDGIEQGIAYRITAAEADPAKTIEQNALQHVWYAAAAEQLREYSAEGYRGYCKLHFGVPIRRAADDEYREAYDRVIRPLSYESKIEIMQVPLDFPVTRDMSRKQLREYLDAVAEHFNKLGVRLAERAA